MSPSRERRRAEDDRPAQPQAGPGQPQAAQARRPRRGLGHRQDVRPRPEGRGSRSGAKDRAALRGRPDADPHADAQAARPAHEEVDAVRAVPDAHAAGQPRATSRRASTPAPRSRSRRSRAKGLATRKGIPVKVLAKGELTKPLTVHAHAFSASAREAHRGRRRHLRQSSSLARRRLSRSACSRRSSAPSPSRRSARSSPSRRCCSRSTGSARTSRSRGSTSQAVDDDPEAVRRRRHPQPAQHCSRGGGLSRIALFALGIMPYITASIILQLLTVVVPVAGEARRRRARSGRRGSRSTRAT